MADETLTLAALNRALLERQGLLARTAMSPVEMLERLVGLQAQVPDNPYVALWSRLEPFAPTQVSELLAGRGAVRANLVRPTIHLVTARDCLGLQALAAAGMAATFQSPYGRLLRDAGVDIDACADAGLELLRERPRTRAELARELAPRWPGAAPLALAHATIFLRPVVQIPPRGLWRGRGQPTYAPTEDWLGAPLDAAPVDAVVLRYLAAFGPAAVADMRVWSRLTGLREVFERLRPRLRCFRDERGRELFDVCDGPLPDPATPAPPRFLPQYDNVLLSHEDRSRIRRDDSPPLHPDGGRWIGNLLIDGWHRATWRMQLEREEATLTVEGVNEPAGDAIDEIRHEALALLELVAPDVPKRAVRFERGR